MQFCAEAKKFIREKRGFIDNEGEGLEQKTLQEVQEIQRDVGSIAVEVNEKLREIEKRRPKDENSEMTDQFRRQQNESGMLGSSTKSANSTDNPSGPPEEEQRNGRDPETGQTPQNKGRRLEH